MEKIGDFSKRCEVTIKTLRYYDKLGLLVPDYIDRFTGYRYYGPEKVAEMRKITELKDIGFTLDEIKQLCSAESGESKMQIISEKRRALEKLTRQLRELTELEQNYKSNLKFKGEKGENKMRDNLNTAFVNDERVIGRWEFTSESDFEEIYFLPGGEEYWGFSWTKDYIKITFGDGLLVPYELKEINGEILMFADYRTGRGSSQKWVLKQTDNKRYTKREIGRYDDINIPFIDDPDVIGKWTSVDFVDKIEEFDPQRPKYWEDSLYLEALEFMPGGQLRERYKNIGRIFYCKWTQGKTLVENGDGTTAPAYEIRGFGGTDYLFLEWKSGDYIWGKRKPGYYVFKRE